MSIIRDVVTLIKDLIDPLIIRTMCGQTTRPFTYLTLININPLKARYNAIFHNF